MRISLSSFSSNKEINLIKEIRPDSTGKIKLKSTENFLCKRYRENVKIIRDNFARSFHVVASHEHDT